MSEEKPSEQGNATAAPQTQKVEAGQGKGSAQNREASLTRSELIEALNSEIKQIEDDYRRPGCSTWALQGAVATLVWLAISEFGPKSNLKNIGIVFLFGSLVVDFCTSANHYLNQLMHPQRKQLRFRFLSEEPNTSPANLVFTILRYGFLLFVCEALDFHIPSLTWYCGVVVFLCAVMMLLRRIKLLAQKRQIPTKTDHWTSWIILIWSAYLVWQLFLVLPFSDNDFKTSDYHVGLLVAAIIYLISLLVTGEKEKPIVDTLKAIRRDLSFGRISVSEATKEADVVLSGLTVVDAIGHDLDVLLSQFQSVIKSFEQLVSECDSVASLLATLEADSESQSDLWKENARKAAIKIDECETKKQISQQAFHMAFFKAQSKMRSIDNLSKTHIAPKPELASKWVELKSTMGKMIDLSKKIGPVIEDIKARYVSISSIV